MSSRAQQSDTLYRSLDSNMNVCDAGRAFYNGIIVVKGPKVMVIAVSDSGYVLVRGSYSDTVHFLKEGPFFHYFPGGGILSVLHYKDDLLNGPVEVKADNGRTVLTGNYIRGMRQGYWTISDLYGRIKFEQYYNLDKKDSTWYTYCPNGSILAIIAYRDGYREGPSAYYYPDKVLYSEGNFKQDKRNGRWYYYLENGTLDRDEYYTLDVSDSIWHWYFPDGKISFLQFYNKGRLRREESVDKYGTPDMQPSFPTLRASFPGGYLDFRAYLNMHIYPLQVLQDTDKIIQFRTEFTIDENGSVKNVQILQGVNPIYDGQIIRILDTMPNWITGMDHNRKVKNTFILQMRVDTRSLNNPAQMLDTLIQK